MAIALPAEKASEILKQIWALSDEQIGNDFYVAGIKREIEKLSSISKSRSNAVYGELYFMLGDVEKAREQYKVSFNYDAYDTVAVSNYCFGLERYGLQTEAYEYATKCFGISNEINALRSLIRVSISNLRILEAYDYYSKYFKMNPEDSVEHKDTLVLYSVITKLRNVMIQYEITDDITVPYAEAVWSVFSKYAVGNINGINRTFSISAEDSGRCELEIKINASVSDICELNMELANELASINLDNKVTRFIVSGFSVK